MKHPDWVVLLTLKVTKHAQQEKKLKGCMGCGASSHCPAEAVQALLHLVTRWAWQHEKLVIQLGELAKTIGQNLVHLGKLTKRLGQKVRGKLMEMQGLVILG